MRRVALVVVVLGLVLAPVTVWAQDDGTDTTSYEPLVRVIDQFVEGEGVSGFVADNVDSSPIASSLQFLVNLSWGPAFVTTDAIPHGLATDGSPLSDLSEIFDDNLTQIPPLHPWGTDNGATDVAALFPDWTAIGEQGPIDGPAMVAEAPTVVWAFELAEPWDETCPQGRSVGRAWMGESLTSSDGPLTEELLEEAFPDGTHVALADGANTRYIELRCWEGSEPQVIANRVNADLGRIRSFGPLDVIALVNGRHVVFFMTERILGIGEVQIDPFFYANDPGGPVAPFEPVADVPALVPNVYDTYSTRITLTMDIPEGEEAADTDEVEGHDLLFRPGQSNVVSAGTGGCPPPVGTSFFADWAEAAFRSGLWSRDASVITFGSFISDEPAEFEGTTPDGRSWTMTVDLETGRVTVRTEECEGTGTASGEPFGTDPGSGDEEIVSGGSDEADINVEPVFTDDSGVPWGLVGVAVVLLAGVGIVVGRSRTRTKDCRPEEEAWDAAIEAFDEAKRTHDYWVGEDEHWGGLYAEAKAKVDRRLPEPNRGLGYPDTPDGQAAYERNLADWQQSEADARQGEADMEAYRERAEAARRNLDEAAAAKQAAADLVWQAQIALQNCRGSAPPLPEGVGAGTGGSGGTDPGPSTPPPSDDTAKGCSPGTTRTVPDEDTPPAEFVIATEVNLRLPTGPWAAFAPNGVADPKALYALSQAEVAELLSDMDRQARNKVRPNASITLEKITVTCRKIERCIQGDEWEDTGQRETAETRTPAGVVDIDARSMLDYQGLASFIAGERPEDPATAQGEAAERGKLRDALAPYIAAEQEYQQYSCD